MRLRDVRLRQVGGTWTSTGMRRGRCRRATSNLRTLILCPPSGTTTRPDQPCPRNRRMSSRAPRVQWPARRAPPAPPRRAASIPGQVRPASTAACKRRLRTADCRMARRNPVRGCQARSTDGIMSASGVPVGPPPVSFGRFRCRVRGLRPQSRTPLDGSASDPAKAVADRQQICDAKPHQDKDPRPQWAGQRP